jgi:hypothetical protein
LSTRINPTTHLTEYEGQDGNWYPVAAPRSARAEGLSADRIRTQKRLALLARGIHPTTKLRLLDESLNRHCADCDHLKAHGGNRKTFYKCDKVYMTSGPATDVRLSWPACEAFLEARHDQIATGVE